MSERKFCHAAAAPRNLSQLLGSGRLRHHQRTPCRPSAHDAATQRLICDLYDADFTCFGYVKPAVCRPLPVRSDVSLAPN